MEKSTKSLWSSFEKLIVEHGSSVVQKERNDAIVEHMHFLKERYEVLQNERNLLERENCALKKEIEALEKRLSLNEEKKENSLILSDKDSEFLLEYFKASDGVYELAFERHFNISRNVVSYHNDRLRDLDFIEYVPVISMGGDDLGSQNFITKAGRAYVMEHLQDKL